MRTATYNVEWFTDLFDHRNRLLRDGGWSSRYQVRRRDQADGLGRVFAAMDADAVMVIEAPDANGKRSTTAPSTCHGISVKCRHGGRSRARGID